MSSFTKRLPSVGVPVAWGAFFLLAWEGFVNWRHVQRFLLPAPSVIGHALADSSQRSLFFRAAIPTATNAVIGLVAGTLLAIVVALLASRFKMIRGLISPISAAFNTMPIVALGPVFYNLFGATSETARRVVVALVAFFPVFVNVLKGLTQVEPVHQELMRSYAASPSALLRLVRVPNALGFFISGLRVAASLSVIAAVVVEYFGGLQNGLGSRVASAMKLSQTAKGWGYICAAIATGLLFYAAGLLIERLVLPWQAHRQHAET
jgi:NitT/TauT family transport system permease protein